MFGEDGAIDVDQAYSAGWEGFVVFHVQLNATSGKEEVRQTQDLFEKRAKRWS